MSVKFSATAFAVLCLALASAWWNGLVNVSDAAFSGNGLWRGHFDINGRGNYEFTGLFVDGELIAISPDARAAYRGSVRFEGDRYHSEMEMFFIDGGPFDKVTLDGNMASPERIEAGFLTHGAGDRGRLSLSYDKMLYEKGASLRKIEDRWILYQGFTITKFRIDGAGRVRGADTNGCGYEGVLEVIDAKYNAYRARLFISSCDERNGEFEGLAFLAGSLAEDDTLHMQVTDDNWNFYMPMVRDRKTFLQAGNPVAHLQK